MSSKPKFRKLPLGLVIVHDDPHLVVVDKPPGLLTIATDRQQERTAYFVLTDYVRKGAAKSRNHVFIVHRLDKEASGLLVFAKNEDVKFALQEAWDEVEKKYNAVVHGSLREKSGTFSSRLIENSIHLVHSTNSPEGKLSRTAYQVLQEVRDFSLLEINLLTGRKHQIRVHLAENGHAIIGDKKYGKKDGQKRLALHATALRFTHPVTRKPLSFVAPAPRYFWSLTGGLQPEES